MTKHKRLKRFMERTYCDKCEDELSLRGTEFCTTEGVTYKYTCNTCREQTTNSIKYPRIIEKEIEE